VENAEKIEVIFAQKNITKSASLKIRDIKNDIAILELKDFSFEEISSEPIPFTFADVSTVKVGQEVYTLGYPLGDIMGTKPRVSLGRINSLFGIQDDPRLYQISNPLQPGNSGGPLFNTKGELVGIVVSSLNAKYLYESAGIIPQNINFAIKSNYLQSLLFLIPEGKEAINRKNLFKSDLIEDQIEKITPFIVQIRVY
jgi:serine protease Do